jgi:hypothetical protein
MSIGEDRVRTKFNPSSDTVVDKIKQKSAELIDICETLKAKDTRLASLAQTHYEAAAMWAVKAVTEYRADRADRHLPDFEGCTLD